MPIDPLPSREEILRHLKDALDALQRQDQYLLAHDVNERTISARLAVHLQHAFPDWCVDCEYNRDGDIPKRLHPSPTTPITWDDTKGSTVFPDVIVHRRGPNGPNLLVIEMKKVGRDDGFDRLKLLEYKAQRGYRVAVLILVHTGGESDIEWSEAGVDW